MPPGGIKSDGTGHIALDDVEHAPSGKVDDQGRVDVRFHDSPQVLKVWCERFQSKFGRDAAEAPLSQAETTCGNAAPGIAKLASPRLNIAIHVVGSRGDVQPFIPIAQMLSRPPFNHRVRICTHPVFKDFIEGHGIEFFSIGGDPEALMAYMVKNPSLLPSLKSVKDGDISKRRKEMWEIMHGAWRSCIEAGDGMAGPIKAANIQSPKDLFIADAIIANPPSMAHIHCAEKLGIPLHIVFTMPWSPTEIFSHPLAAISYGDADTAVANYLSFMMLELLTWQGPMWGYQLLSRLRVPHSYLWSKSLIPKPSDWASHINVTGFSFLPLASSYTPPPDLVTFLEKGTPPIYIGFGSIVVEDPQALRNLVFDAVKLANVRAVVSQGWGTLGGEDVGVPENLYLIGNCPHDWLFQRVSVVVHHGGAGTTAAGIAAGRPTVVVPFFGDQPFWGQMIARAGAGPTPIPFKKMTAESLAASILFALNPEVKEAAQRLAQTIMQEDGASNAAMDFLNRLDVDKLRCDLCPDRLAIWKHKSTGTRLSGFAMTCLVDKKLVQPNDSKLLQHRHWYVNEGAEHPIIGAVAAASGLFTALGTAASDYHGRLKGRHRPVASSSETLHQPSSSATIVDEAAWRAQEQGINGHAYYIARATGRFAVDVTKASLKAPVAFFYNVANGFHNYPSYSFGATEVRRRGEITGLGSGLRVAGEEFVLGFWDAFSGLVMKPYESTKDEGARGFSKGVLRGARGFAYNLGASIFAVPGYALKGVEKELAKHRLTKLKSEVLLIRLRQGIEDFRTAAPEERAAVVTLWESRRK
ncbi:Sterol 3-beta-glucosyltransferase [Fusarium oxysporum f. sp. cubense race 1]|uniref:Sterol 3-beta-glucosyltransferase n=1 Tax=Fusarium oxysporum f. sp. cubense (strain race 1) TaxID=1229664 RepID=N4UBB8_FUSC1|nr:Sterol 3-beta-glucosyltransferase [Fusarium oxysporum f. sp. cubense race 1]